MRHERRSSSVDTSASGDCSALAAEFAKGSSEQTVQLTARDTLKCQVLFVLIGISAMYYWNAVIQTLYSVVVIKHAESVNTIMNVYTTVAVFCSFVLSVFGAGQPWMHFVGGFTLLAMCILFPVIVCHVPGTAGVVALHLTSAVAGASEMLFQCSGYSFAVLLNRRFAGYISFGYGGCGVTTFVVWILLSEVIFPIRHGSERNMTWAVWLQFVAGALIISASMWLARGLLKMPQMTEALKLEVKGVNCEAPTSEEAGRAFFAVPSEVIEVADSVPERHRRCHGVWAQIKSVWPVFRRTWQMQIGLGICQGMSMMAYPLIGPYMFGLSVAKSDVLTGIFQCGDFLGRYIPNLATFLPMLLVPAKFMLPLTLMRAVLLGLFIYTAKLVAEGNTDNVLTHYGTEVTLMAALALSHGYYGSVFMIRMTENLVTPRAKVQASAMAVCLLVACIAIGMWLARLVRF